MCGEVHFRIGTAADTATLPEELRALVASANGQLARDNLLEDAPIWKRKRFNPRPKLTDADGPIGATRRWATRFFPELGPIMAAAEDASPGDASLSSEAGRHVWCRVLAGGHPAVVDLDGSRDPDQVRGGGQGHSHADHLSERELPPK